MKDNSLTTEPVEIVGGDPAKGLLLICDHARADIPAAYDNLGLPSEELERHIAYDIGVRDVTLKLAETLGLPAVLSTFSRLLIDPNRGADDPTLVMRLSDGALIPGNARIDGQGIEDRKRAFYEPYHCAVAAQLEEIERTRPAAAIFSIHSFTPVWRGLVRPWEAAILWDSDPRLPRPLIDGLRVDPTLTIGDNEPYDGALKNDCLYRHGTSHGRAHALLELRQDLIADSCGVAEWVERLSPILEALMEDDRLFEKRFFTSRADQSLRGSG